MAGGLVALLDDVAALAKLAAASLDDIGAGVSKASVKAIGVVVDDTAVTPAYLRGFAAKRELPMVKRIAIGSLRNKLVFILPVAMLLSEFLPGAIAYLLIFGGLFLCYEGAEKVYEAFFAGHEAPEETIQAAHSPEHEQKMVSGAIRTDLILSAEIMAISLAAVTDQPFITRLFIMIGVALVITLVVYGTVALIVKMDDVGLALAERDGKFVPGLGRGLVKAMPKVMAVIATVGTGAMLWVGGHIVIANVAEAFWHGPLDVLHIIEVFVADLAPAGIAAVSTWTTETVLSAIVGLVLGAIIVLVVHFIPRRNKMNADPEPAH